MCSPKGRWLFLSLFHMCILYPIRGGLSRGFLKFPPKVTTRSGFHFGGRSEPIILFILALSSGESHPHVTVIQPVFGYELARIAIVCIPRPLYRTERTCVGVALALDVKDSIDCVCCAAVTDSDHDCVLV